MRAVLCHNIGCDDLIYQGQSVEKGVKKQSTRNKIGDILLLLSLVYNPIMLKLLLNDRLFQVLIVLLVATICAWSFRFLVYPFGLLVLSSLTMARFLHLYAMQNAKANSTQNQ